MKKRNMKMTSVVLAAALAAVSLAGCGGSGKTETTAAAGSADTTAAETGSEAESSEAAGGEAKEGGYKVAMISDTSVSDGGWGASCYQAMVDAAAEKGWETVYTDNVATSDYATVMTDYAELGYDLIFAPGNQYTDAVKQVAEEYPEIKFALLNGTVETDNIQSILPDAEQMDNGAGTTITNENFSLTDQVSAEANVVSDIWPTGLAGEDTSQKPKEQPYVKSDETQILFQ